MTSTTSQAEAVERFLARVRIQKAGYSAFCQWVRRTRFDDPVGAKRSYRRFVRLITAYRAAYRRAQG